MFYLMKSKYVIFSNIKVTKIERSDLWGHPVYCTMIFFLKIDNNFYDFRGPYRVQ